MIPAGAGRQRLTRPDPTAHGARCPNSRASSLRAPRLLRGAPAARGTRAHVSSRECPRFRHPGRRSDRRHPPRSAGDGLLRSRRLEGSRTRYHEPRADGLARRLAESSAAARGPRSSVPGALWFPGPRVCGTSSPGRGSRAPGRVSQPAGSRAAAVTGRAECARVCARVRAGSPSRVCGSPQSHRLTSPRPRHVGNVSLLIPPRRSFHRSRPIWATSKTPRSSATLIRYEQLKAGRLRVSLDLAPRIEGSSGAPRGWPAGGAAVARRRGVPADRGETRFQEQSSCAVSAHSCKLWGVRPRKDVRPCVGGTWSLSLLDCSPRAGAVPGKRRASVIYMLARTSPG